MSNREKISVCMATYNGTRFVREQLESILPQLGIEDEVVVVDDASQDETVAVIRQLADGRIKLEQNEQNLGVIGCFERAIGTASGDVLFLSDQDDVWDGDKVNIILSTFSDRPDVSLISTDVDFVDERGEFVSAGYPRLQIGDETRFGKLLRNLYKNRYLGCTLAFRSSVLPYVLPFPKDIPMHDTWIGMVNDLVGKTLFLDQRLVRYRRHEANATTGLPVARAMQIKHRIALVRRLVELAFRRRWAHA